MFIATIKNQLILFKCSIEEYKWLYWNIYAVVPEVEGLHLEGYSMHVINENI